MFCKIIARIWWMERKSFRLMKDERMDNIPIILETPNEEIWAEEIAWLKSEAGE